MRYYPFFWFVWLGFFLFNIYKYEKIKYYYLDNNSMKIKNKKIMNLYKVFVYLKHLQ